MDKFKLRTEMNGPTSFLSNFLYSVKRWYFTELSSTSWRGLASWLVQYPKTPLATETAFDIFWLACHVMSSHRTAPQYIAPQLLDDIFSFKLWSHFPSQRMRCKTAELHVQKALCVCVCVCNCHFKSTSYTRKLCFPVPRISDRSSHRSNHTSQITALRSITKLCLDSSKRKVCVGFRHSTRLLPNTSAQMFEGNKSPRRLSITIN